eukprot:g852.t1
MSLLVKGSASSFSCPSPERQATAIECQDLIGAWCPFSLLESRKKACRRFLACFPSRDGDRSKVSRLLHGRLKVVIVWTALVQSHSAFLAQITLQKPRHISCK